MRVALASACACCCHLMTESSNVRYHYQSCLFPSRESPFNTIFHDVYHLLALAYRLQDHNVLEQHNCIGIIYTGTEKALMRPSSSIIRASSYPSIYLNHSYTVVYAYVLAHLLYSSCEIIYPTTIFLKSTLETMLKSWIIFDCHEPMVTLLAKLLCCNRQNSCIG